MVNPVAVADSYIVNAGTTLSTSSGTGILANDQGLSLSKNTVQTGPFNGSLNLNADGSFDYVANAGFSGVDTTRMRSVLGFHPQHTTVETFDEFVRARDLNRALPPERVEAMENQIVSLFGGAAHA